MSKPLRPKRGTTAENDAFTGLPYEVTLDTDTHRLRTHDGVTAGGYEHALKSDIPVVMAGASASVAGKAGMVPEPKAGEQDYVLTGDGAWREKAPKADKALALYDAEGQEISVAKLAEMLSNYLPLTGGTITGALTHRTNNRTGTINCSTDDQGLYLLSADGTLKGAYIALKGNNAAESPGTFALNAYNPQNKERHQLAGLAEGLLLWKGNLVTTAEYVYTQYRTTSGGTLTLPSGGTWKATWFIRSSSSVLSYNSGTYAGGTTIATVGSGSQGGVFAIRVA